MQSETRKRGERTNNINSAQKLVRLHRRYQRYKCVSHQCKMCLQKCGINPGVKVSIGRHQKYLLKQYLTIP